MIRKIGTIEYYELSDDLSIYTRKEREAIIKKLFEDCYQGMDISYLLNGNEVSALINSRTKKNFIARGHSGTYERNREYNTRQDIAYSGDYLNLISNLEYQYSQSEKKPDQGGVHNENNMWHYFKKTINCNGYFFVVSIDVLEKQEKYYVYNAKLKEVDVQSEAPNKISTSYNQILSEDENDCNSFLDPDEDENELYDLEEMKYENDMEL